MFKFVQNLFLSLFIILVLQSVVPAFSQPYRPGCHLIVRAFASLVKDHWSSAQKGEKPGLSSSYINSVGERYYAALVSKEFFSWQTFLAGEGVTSALVNYYNLERHVEVDPLVTALKVLGFKAEDVSRIEEQLYVSRGTTFVHPRMNLRLLFRTQREFPLRARKRAAGTVNFLQGGKGADIYVLSSDGIETEEFGDLFLQKAAWHEAQADIVLHEFIHFLQSRTTPWVAFISRVNALANSQSYIQQLQLMPITASLRYRSALLLAEISVIRDGFSFVAEWLVIKEELSSESPHWDVIRVALRTAQEKLMSGYPGLTPDVVDGALNWLQELRRG